MSTRKGKKMKTEQHSTEPKSLDFMRSVYNSMVGVRRIDVGTLNCPIADLSRTQKDTKRLDDLFENYEVVKRVGAVVAS